MKTIVIYNNKQYNLPKDNKSLGFDIKMNRISKNLTLQELSVKSGISTYQLSKLENGEIKNKMLLNYFDNDYVQVIRPIKRR